jgi:hypothetical protein
MKDCTFPLHRDDEGDLSCPCFPRGATKILPGRTLPPRIIVNETIDVLQDEDGFPILDEATGSTIIDDLRE